MPTVPVYPDRQVRTAPLQPVLQNTPDVSSGSRAIAQGLGQVAEAADRIDLRDAQAKASEVDQRITAEWLRWDASPEGRAKYRGANADGYAAAAEAWWEKAKESNAQGLNPRAMALASPSLQSKRTSAINNAMQFQAAEKERHADEAYTADVSTTIQFGISTGEVASARLQILDKAATLGARKGWTTAQVQAEQGRQLSGLHLAHITRLASANPTAAQAYYDANKAEINGANQPRVEEVLRAEGDNQFATQFAAGVAARPLGEQLAEAAKIPDPQRREKALTQIRNNNALVRQAQKEVEDKMSDQAWQLFSQGQRIPEVILSGMNGRERAQLTEAVRVRSERMSAGRSVKTDWATYIDAREKLARGERVDLRSLTEKIGPAQMEQLLDIQTRAARPGPGQDSIISDGARIDNALVGLGIDKKKNPEGAGRIAQEIDRRVREASTAKGDRPLSPDEKQAIVDRVVLDRVYVTEWGRDPQKPVSMLTPEEMTKAYVTVNGRNVLVSSVPSSFRERALALRTRRGLPISEQLIVEDYLAKQAETGGRTSSGTIR
jgi:hypothetical protein